MHTLSTLKKVLPLCLGLFLMAAEDDCTIRIITDDDECEDVEEVCNLDCELATNDNGCELCECAASEGEGEGEGEGECDSDADCRDGQHCELLEGCPPCVSEGCDVACTLTGTCVDDRPDPCIAARCAPDTLCVADEHGNAQCVPVDPGCFGDDECGPGAYCDFSTCGARPGGDGDLIACQGTCVEVEPVTCANVDCVGGTHCVDTFEGPQCVPNDSQCESDEQCAPGQHCEIVCGTDPNCPVCDVCIFQGVCVNDACPALCDPGSECVIHDDGSAECEPIVPPPATCASDEGCADGLVCNAAEICLPNPACASDGSGLVVCTGECWGYCVEPTPASCSSDAECGADELCELTATCPDCGNPDTDPACLAPCFLEGKCVPRG